MSKRTKSVLFVLLLVGISLNFLISISQNNRKFFDGGYSNLYETYRNSYYNSQYVRKVNPVIMNDEIFESFAGGAFLKGMNPILIVHDHPPLGRYMVSLSILLFNNPSTIIPILLSASFIGIFLLGFEILRNKFLALVPLALFMNEPLTLNKLVYTPLPEPIQLPFIIFSLYVFLLAVRHKKNIWLFCLTSILLGIVISTRFFVTGAGIFLAMNLYLIFVVKNFGLLWKFLVSAPLALVVLILSYSRTMLDGYSILEVFGIQKYILSYHQSKFVNAFSFWDLILFNRWHTWWDGNKILSDNQWQLFWPIALVSTILNALFIFWKKLKPLKGEMLLLFWAGIYCAMLSTGYTSTRYFLPLLPVLYILATGFIFRLLYKLAYNIFSK